MLYLNLRLHRHRVFLLLCVLSSVLHNKFEEQIGKVCVCARIFFVFLHQDHTLSQYLRVVPLVLKEPTPTLLVGSNQQIKIWSCAFQIVERDH